jgi:acetylornithine deacetylase/succinyl-diaminopimelate desuccinylase-like protein
MDKQPPLTKDWEEGLGPYTPVIREGKLYGRGGADDGYALFAALSSIKTLQLQGVGHARCVILIEACEESGSRDLPTYISHLKDRIKIPSLIVCLDSGCGNYEQLWMTTTLRGLITADLKVQVLREGVHSGAASGIVPSSFRILRNLLNRIEDVETGKVLVPECHTNISEYRLKQTQQCAQVLGDVVHGEMPWPHASSTPVVPDNTELLLNKCLRPALAITGVDGMPPIETAGNVLRPYTAVKLSLRLPPGVDPAAAGAAVKATLERDPPYGAKVTCTLEKAAAGWASPELVPWLEESVKNASLAYFKKEAQYLGEGGSIPFMGMLGELFPKAQFVITGLLGPKSNAHGPNEFLEINMGKKLTCCVVSILADHANHLL